MSNTPQCPVGSQWCPAPNADTWHAAPPFWQPGGCPLLGQASPTCSGEYLAGLHPEPQARLLQADGLRAAAGEEHLAAVEGGSTGSLGGFGPVHSSHRPKAPGASRRKAPPKPGPRPASGPAQRCAAAPGSRTSGRKARPKVISRSSRWGPALVKPERMSNAPCGAAHSRKRACHSAGAAPSGNGGEGRTPRRALPFPGNAVVNLLGTGGDLLHIPAALLHDGGPQLDEPGVPHLQGVPQLREPGDVLQKGVALGKGPVVHAAFRHSPAGSGTGPRLKTPGGGRAPPSPAAGAPGRRSPRTPCPPGRSPFFFFLPVDHRGAPAALNAQLGLLVPALAEKKSGPGRRQGRSPGGGVQPGQLPSLAPRKECPR